MTVVCELTMKLAHGADARPVEAAPFYDDVLARTADADFRAPFKPRADVLLVGHCYAPADEGDAERLLVRMRVGDYSKALRVTGDRFWLREGGRLVPGAPRKFRRILLSGERAARSPENPLGMDLDALPVEHRIALPNLEPASVGYSAIVGPVPHNAPARAGLVHPMMLGWVHAVMSGQRAGPPPEGFNFGYFNIAPFDQQLPELPVGAAIVLEHVHPAEPVFTSRLPPMKPRAFVFDPQALRQLEVPLRLDTLWIDAERELATLVFRGVIPISHPDLASQVITRVETVERSVAPPPPEMTATQVGVVEPAFAGLPFQKAPPGAAPPPRAEAPDAPRAAGKTLPPAPLPGGMYVTQEISVGPGLGALPFDSETTQSLIEDPTTAAGAKIKEPARPPPASDPPTPRPFTHPAVQIVRLVPPDIGPTPEPPLPPRPSTKPRGAPEALAEAGALTMSAPGAPVFGRPVAPPHAVDVKEAPLPSFALRPPPSTRLGAMALGTGKLASSEPPAARVVAPPAPIAAVAPKPREPSTIDEPTTSREEPTSLGTPKDEPTDPPTTDSSPPTVSRGGAKPAETKLEVPRPQVPIFAKPDNEVTMSEELTDASTADRKGLGIEARTLEEAEADADRDAFEFPLPPSDGFEVDGVTLEHCAAIRAAIAMPGADRTGVLAKHQLDEAAFARIEKAHLSRLDQETSSGTTDLLNRYDAAYVAAQDALRRPIGVKEYARIVVAKKSGELAEALSELGVPRSELMRLDRVWKRRVAEHAGVAKTLEATIEALSKKR